MLVTLMVAAFLDSDRALVAARGISQPVVRDVLTSVLTPINAIASPLHLHAPRQALEAAIGKEPISTDAGDPDGLDAQAAAIEQHLREDGKVRPRETPASPRIRQPSRESTSAIAFSRTAKNGVSGRYIEMPDVPADLLAELSAKKRLRVLVTGDSTSYEPGFALIKAMRKKPVDVQVASFTGTGLLRPDAFDWKLKASAQMRATDPDVVVVFMGPNDFYPIDGARFGTPDWTTKYAARIQAVMAAFATTKMSDSASDGSRLVLWAPPSIDELANPYMPRSANQVIRAMHSATRLAAENVPGAAHLDTYSLFAVRGRFSSTVHDPVTGKKVRGVRRPDGTHYTPRGGRVIANVIGDWLTGVTGRHR